MAIGAPTQAGGSLSLCPKATGRSCSRSATSTSRRSVTKGFVRHASSAVLSPPVLPFQREAEHLQQWTRDSWRSREAKQQPNYPDENAVSAAIEELERMPPLVFAGECRNLQAKLAACSSGDAFWLQGELNLTGFALYSSGPCELEDTTGNVPSRMLDVLKQSTERS